MSDTYEALLTAKEVSVWLGFTTQALDAWRRQGTGPKYIRVSKRAIRYRPDDVRTWIAEKEARES